MNLNIFLKNGILFFFHGIKSYLFPGGKKSPNVSQALSKKDILVSKFFLLKIWLNVGSTFDGKPNIHTNLFFFFFIKWGKQFFL